MSSPILSTFSVALIRGPKGGLIAATSDDAPSSQWLSPVFFRYAFNILCMLWLFIAITSSLGHLNELHTIGNILPLFDELYYYVEYLIAVIMVIGGSCAIVLHRRESWQAIILTFVGCCTFLSTLLKKYGHASIYRNTAVVISGLIIVVVTNITSKLSLVNFADLKDSTKEEEMHDERVGTCSIFLRDPARKAWVGKAVNASEGIHEGIREIHMKLWYPASETNVSSTSHSNYDKVSAAMSRLPEWETPRSLKARLSSIFFRILMSTFALTRGSAKPWPSIARKDRENTRFPVLIFSHGHTGSHDQNASLCEKMAARGFVVAAPDHTYDAAFALQADGSAVPTHSNCLSKGISDEATLSVRRRHLDVRVNDALLVLDVLEAANDPTSAVASNISEHPLLADFAGRLDLSRVGIMGHSFGGTTAIQCCAVAPHRVHACLGLDPWMWPVADDVLAEGIDQPICFLRAPIFLYEKETWTKNNSSQVRQFVSGARAVAYDIILEKATHFDYTDVSLIDRDTSGKPSRNIWGNTGAIAGCDSNRIICDVTSAFFETALENTIANTRTIEEVMHQWPDYLR